MSVVVVRTPTFVTVAGAGPQGPPGEDISSAAGTLSAPVVGGGVLDVTVASHWGIDPTGLPYYDPNGAAPADAAIATLGADGLIHLIDTRGGAVTVAVTSVNGHTGTTVVVTKGDVGLGLVDNTSDATKNSASVTLTNKTLTAPVITSPTGLVKADVGLGNCDNTADVSKPVSTAQAAYATSRAVAMALVLGS